MDLIAGSLVLKAFSAGRRRLVVYFTGDRGWAAAWCSFGR
jgi:hypothetical protein